jgi:hypothetical protein
MSEVTRGGQQVSGANSKLPGGELLMNNRFWWPGVLASNPHRTLTAVIQKRLPLVRVWLRGHVPEIVHDYEYRVSGANAGIFKCAIFPRPQ